MRIKITSTGIFGGSGEVQVGSEFDLQSDPPQGWHGRYVVISESTAGAQAIVNQQLTAESIESMERVDVLAALEARDWTGDKRLSVDKLRAELVSLISAKK